MEALGTFSSDPEADDRAFHLASSPVLAGYPDLRRRWLEWVARTHEGRTGGIRAAELLRWIETGADLKVYGYGLPRGGAVREAARSSRSRGLDVLYSDRYSARLAADSRPFCP